MNTLTAQIDAVQTEFKGADEGQKLAIANLSIQITNLDIELRSSLKDLASGGLRIQAYGIAFLVTGTIFNLLGALLH